MQNLGGNRWKFDTRDLMRATTCRHCTILAVMRELKVPVVLEAIAPYLEQEKTLAQKYGDKYENDLVNELMSSLPGGSVREPALGETATMAERIAATTALMSEGVPVIYQGAMQYECGNLQFRGKPDFLVHQDWELLFDKGHFTARQVRSTMSDSKPRYTAWDAKYANHAKPAYALQVALYIAALDAIGFLAEDATHGVVLGGRTLEPFKASEILGAMELAHASLAITIADLTATITDSGPNAVLSGFTWSCVRKSYCDICEYPDLCDLKRHENGDLLLVHGVMGSQVEKLKESGIHTLEQLANANTSRRPGNLDENVWNRLQSQARAQLVTVTSGKPYYELLPNPALEYLPPANDGDVFFDMEGFPYHREKGGLEYLFGNWTPEGDFVDFWAHDRREEAQAFSNFMEWLIKRLNANPEAHVYHYAAYEQTALRKLAARHGVYETELTGLEQAGKFVDLLNVVKKSLVVGQESYSVKYLEAYYGFKRTAEVKKATDSISGYDDWLELQAIADGSNADAEQRAEAKAAADQLLADLRQYNKEDVISTKALYDWLASLPGAGTKFGADVNPKDDAAEEKQTASALKLQELQLRTERLFAPLKNWVPSGDGSGDVQSKAWAALAHSILFYRREDVIFWTDLFIRLSQDATAMQQDRKAELLKDVAFLEFHELKNPRAGQGPRITYSATLDPEGLYQPKPEDDVIIRFVGSGMKPRWAFGEVLSNDFGRVTFRRTSRITDQKLLPDAIFEYSMYLADSKQAALNDLADQITSEWGSPNLEPPQGYPGLDLLLRRPPRFKSRKSLTAANTVGYLGDVLAAVDDLDNSVLAIQGSPGSGKTYLASRTIKQLVEQGFRVGVTANSHKASENLLAACIDAGVSPEVIYKRNKGDSSEPQAWKVPKTSQALVSATKELTHGHVIGGTSWTFSSGAIANKKFDYIFIDEAAQFSMVDALAVSAATRNLILLGDPQQLPQVVSAIHPGGVENSALGHYMGESQILPPHMGFFLAETRRMHPEVNAPVSWLSYENQLVSNPMTGLNRAGELEPGLLASTVEHRFNSTFSQEEAARILEILHSHLEDQPKVTQNQVLVVSPYNAQVDLLRRLLDARGYEGVEVGTVDKFQGREADLLLVSLAASSSEEAPRGLEFVLDRNRLNVAISRAKATCILIYSPHILQANFRNLGELKAISRFKGLLGFSKPYYL